MKYYEGLHDGTICIDNYSRINKSILVILDNKVNVILQSPSKFHFTAPSAWVSYFKLMWYMSVLLCTCILIYFFYLPIVSLKLNFLGSWMTTCLRKSCSFGLPCVLFVNCCQFLYLVISLWFWRQDVRSDCISSWSLFIVLLYVYII